MYAVETGYFTFRSYQQDGSSFKFVENSETTLTVTPQPVQLQPSTSQVGAQTSLTIKIQLEHELPLTGSILITFPKWNPFASSQSLMQSYLTVSTSPGFVSCQPVSVILYINSSQNFAVSSLTCVFTQGTTTDTLQVYMASSSSTASSISANTLLSFKLLNARLPPSQTKITNITATTVNQKSQLIDQATGISYQATQAGTIPSSYVQIEALTTDKINSQTQMQISIKNVNPIPQGSKLVIEIPEELGTNDLNSVTGSGRIKINPSNTLSSDKKTITLTSFNDNYLEPLVAIYVTLDSIKTPSSTGNTQSFKITLIDPSNQEIEKCTTGVYFSATPGTISTASVSSDNRYINMNNVKYTFTFSSNDAFKSTAQIKIVFPDQLSITNRNSQSLTSYNDLISSSARLTVTQNKYAYITRVFKADYNPSSSGQISFTIDGVTNSALITNTESFQIYIFYDEDADVVSYLTSGLTISFEASPFLKVQASLKNQETGSNTIMQIVGNTQSYKILKGSYIKVLIPPQFAIYNYNIAQSTCIKIAGFSDEISCSFGEYSDVNGHQLIIRNGFSSQDFSGGVFSFNISEVRNPKNTLVTGGFQMNVFDSSNNLQYFSDSTFTMVMNPAPFQYALISSSSSANGQSSIYTFTLTLSVDTPLDSQLQITLPPEIIYDKSKQFLCKGIQNLNQTLPCYQQDDSTFQLTIRNDYKVDSSIKTFISNGTNIGFQLGYLINPQSIEQTQSFKIQSFILRGSDQYFIQVQEDGMSIQNTIQGNLSQIVVTQYIQELNQPTSLRFRFTTQNYIPNESRILLTIPPEMQVNHTRNLNASINRDLVDISYSANSRQFIISIPSVRNNSQNYFDLNISKGLINPLFGPYKLDTFLIEIQNNANFSIDRIQLPQANSSSSTFVQVNCTSNCGKCSYKLDNCDSCTYNQTTAKSYFFQQVNGKNLCLDTCPAGQYGDEAEFRCKQCEYPCMECKYGPSQCTKCYSNHTAPFVYEQTLSCYQTCPVGTYAESSQMKCVQCQSPCLTCQDKETCLSCNRIDSSNTFVNYLDNKCYQNCPEGYVASLQNLCVQCNSPCKTCKEQPDQCTSCLDGYYTLRSQLCVTSCPKDYQANEETKSCDFIGERAFPLPFSILTALFSLGLLIARFMKNQTRYFITVLSFTDIALKCNWVFLLIYLFAGKFMVSASIIAYCLGMNFIVNFVFWRIGFKRKRIFEDQDYQKYVQRYPRVSRFILFVSFVLSFHFFRVSYSRLLGKKAFAASISNYQNYVRLICVITVINLIFVCFPAVAANAYNLNFTDSTQQVYYFDIDGMILVLYEVILILIVGFQGEKYALGPLKNILKEVMKDDKSFQFYNVEEEEKKKVEGLIKEMRKKSLAERYFHKDADSQEQDDQDRTKEEEKGLEQEHYQQKVGELNEIAEEYSKGIFKNLFRQFQSQTSLNTNTKGYFSQTNNLGVIELDEFKVIKSKIRSLQSEIERINQLIQTSKTKKQMISTKYTQLSSDTTQLLNQEEQLKAQIEALKQELQAYREQTLVEMQETEAYRREQIRRRVKINKLKQFIAERALQKGKEILQAQQKLREEEERIRKEEEERIRQELLKRREEDKRRREERRNTYIEPTMSSLMKDREMNLDIIEEAKDAPVQQVIEVQKQRKRRDTTISPHLSRPPLYQRDRPHNIAYMKTSLQDSSKNVGNRIGVAENFTSFRAQSEMRNQRAKNLINSGVQLMKNEGNLSPTVRQTEDFNSPEARNIQTAMSYIGGSADKRISRFMPTEQTWMQDNYDETQHQ